VTHDPLPAVRIAETHALQLFQNLMETGSSFRGSKRPWCMSRHAGWGSLVVFVKDNGIGIEREYATKCLVCFKRLHGNRYSGTGIAWRLQPDRASLRRADLGRVGERAWRQIPVSTLPQRSPESP